MNHQIQNLLKGLIPAIIGILILLFIVATPFVVIPSGFVGVKLTLGKADMNELPPGLHIIIPMIQQVEKMSVRTSFSS